MVLSPFIRFDYSDPKQRKVAALFRDAELPFKVYNVPELTAASIKWTDEYVDKNFVDGKRDPVLRMKEGGSLAHGNTQESPNHYFAFFVPERWPVAQLGLPPFVNNDWSYGQWAKHALYADAVSLASDQPHFYWQAGVNPHERFGPWNSMSFISKDLPSFSSKEDNFFLFHADQQKGIQCRFGERGVTAATHYDGGRNMVAMIKGAKRYILSPPKQCARLGIFTDFRSPIYRHSLLNFAHLNHMNEEGMSKEERAWLQEAAHAKSVETVLKEGEVLYIPSHWFHYIVSVQKSAQCNVRSGISDTGSEAFGDREDVTECSI